MATSCKSQPFIQINQCVKSRRVATWPYTKPYSSFNRSVDHGTWSSSWFCCSGSRHSSLSCFRIVKEMGTYGQVSFVSLSHLSLPCYLTPGVHIIGRNKLHLTPKPVMNFQCRAQMQARYLLPWHFFWQNYSFSAVMYISVRILLRCKLLNYSVEGLQTRLVKWLPINKTLQNQISPDILSCSCHTARLQVWISVAFASPQSWTRRKKKKNSGEKDNCK